jgi:hypothetical protein
LRIRVAAYKKPGCCGTASKTCEQGENGFNHRALALKAECGDGQADHKPEGGKAQRARG